MLQLMNAVVQPLSSSSDVLSRLQLASSQELGVEELISSLVLDCLDNAVSDKMRSTPLARGAAIDACDSDSGISDTTPASAGGDVAGASLCSTPDVEQPMNTGSTRVQYDGRDILDLANNLKNPMWNLAPTLLPPMNLDMFWKNRSQYHRLGDFGAAETHDEICCPDCDFHHPVPPS